MTTTEPKRLGNRYELGDLLGRGGMAEVRRGHDTRLGRTVAIKTLRTDLAREPTFQQRFRREAQSAASLNHPSIVAVYDTGEDLTEVVPVPYIVMEYVDGDTLRDLLQSDRRLLPERALEIARGVLDALEYSHRQGIVHRDIKPANVMLTQNGGIKVMDFGIARAVADTAATMTQTAAVIGTAQYLSPEQARGERVDARSDIYSAGCLLYELLTGRPPFLGDSPVSVAYQHVREMPIPPSQLDPDMPAYVDAITMKALAKSADNRYQTAGDMRTDIERALAGQQVLAPPVIPGATAQFSTTEATTTLPAQDVPPRRGGWAWALLLLAAVGVFLVTMTLGRALLGPSPDSIAVPDLVSLTVTEAQERLQEQGLILGTQRTESSGGIPKDRIISHDPPADKRVERNSAVNIVVSSGPEQATVPQLAGLSLEDATQKLEQAQLKIGTLTPRDDPDRSANTILSSEPSGGTKVEVGSAVNLVIVSGNVEVPSVIGRQETDATKLLAERGFKVTPQRLPDSAPQGQVVEQTPNGGDTKPVGSTVTIIVSSGQAATSTPTSTPTPTSTSTSTSTPTRPTQTPSATGSPTASTPTTPPTSDKGD